jgi:hypothetical protein
VLDALIIVPFATAKWGSAAAARYGFSTPSARPLDGPEKPFARRSPAASKALKALARAHRWQRLLEEGRFGTLSELAGAERISRSCVCRVLRLTLLAPDIVERILNGRPTAGLAPLVTDAAVRVSTASDMPQILGEDRALTLAGDLSTRYGREV